MDDAHRELLGAALSIEARIKSSPMFRDHCADILPRFEAAISTSAEIRTEENFKEARREAHEAMNEHDEQRYNEIVARRK